MANGLYDGFKESVLNKEHDLNTDEIDAILIDGADYTSNLATDTTIANIPVAARVAISAAMTSPTITGGVFDCADFSWLAVTGDQSEEVGFYNDTEATDKLVCLFDTGITGMPVTPNGGDINVTINASGIFAL